MHFSACIATTHLLRVDSQTTELSQLTELNSSGHSGSLSPWLGIYEEEKTLYDEFVSNITFQDGRLLPIAADNLQPTKRNLVSLIGRFYDPLGFLAPITIKFKVLFQKLCQSRLDWDGDLLEELLREWRSLLGDLKEAAPVSIPRSYDYRVEGAPILPLWVL